jgi:hypothetical protein
MVRISIPHTALAQNGFAHRLLLLGVALVVVLAFYKIEGHSVADTTTIIKSGVSGYCLDDYKNKPDANNKVDSWGCNDTSAQSWSLSGDNIIHNSDCLSVLANATNANMPIVAASCNDAPGQVWLRDSSGYYNPNSGMCLDSPGSKQQLIISSCSNPITPTQSWTPSTPSNKDVEAPSCQGTEGQLVACYAEKEWANWQSGSISHENLLNTYTDGSPYEEWCADFVSYVYKEAGYPFTQAYGGWDENNANNVQDYGFTIHMASSGYTPKPGDIGFFNYVGGHVEIVISGGETPTFIYGNSATIDPTTGNGQMKANTITNDGSQGELIYYLSPN